MKAGWQVKPLGEVCTLQRGFDLPTSRRVPGSFPLVTSSGPTDTHSEFKVAGPGVVTGRSGSIGNAFFVQEDFWPLNTTLFVKDFHGNDPKFVWYLLIAFDLSRFSSGSGVPTLNRNDVHGELVSVTSSLAEQKRIVAVLDEAFEGLDRARANAEANLADARELFLRELDNHFSELAQEVPVRVLGDVAEIKGGKRLPQGEELTSENTGFPYISVRDFGEDGTVNPRKLRYISEKAFHQISRYVIYSSDLYVSIAGTIGKTGIIPKCLDGANLTENAARLVLRGQVGNEYLYYFTRTSDFERQVGLNTRTAAQPKLALSRLATIRFPVPDISRQTETVEKFDALRRYCEEIEAQCRAKIADLATLRQSLLQKAFSGELG